LLHWLELVGEMDDSAHRTYVVGGYRTKAGSNGYIARHSHMRGYGGAESDVVETPIGACWLVVPSDAVQSTTRAAQLGAARASRGTEHECSSLLLG
jgi:hypothetical protein